MAPTPNPTPAAAGRRRPLAPAIVRYLLGLPLVFFGLNGFFNFVPMQPPHPLPPGAAAFSAALVNTGYMMGLIAGTQVFVGLCLLANRWVPLALAVLAPFLVNSLAFHLFLEPGGRPPALVFTACELYLAWAYRSAFRPMLAARVGPG